MENKNQRKAGAALSYVSIIVNTLIQLLYTPLLIRMLGQSEYGLYSLVSSIIGYLTIMDLGFGNAIIVYTAKYRAQEKYEEEKKLHGMFNIVFKVIGVIAFFLGIILFFNVNNMFGNTMTSLELEKMKIMMLILSFNLLLTFYFAIYSSIMNAYEKFTFHKVVSIIHSILKPALMIPLLFIGFKSITLCLVLTFTNLFVLLLNKYYCNKKMKVTIKYSGFDKLILKTVFKYSIWIFIGVIVDKINWSVDNFVLGAVSGTIAVSIYAIASTLNHLFINLSKAISGVLLPKMAKMIARNANSEELTNEFIKVGRIQYYIIFLMCSGLILFGKNFIITWAGEGFEESYCVALLLIIPVCIPLIQNLGISIMQAMNKYKFRSISTFVMSIINVIISIYFSKMWGAVGAALGTCLALILCNVIIMNIYYYKVIKLDILKFWKCILIQSIPFIIPVIMGIVMCNLTNLTGFKGFVIYGSIYTIIYCLTAYFLSMNSYEKQLVNNVMAKIKLKRKKI